MQNKIGIRYLRFSSDGQSNSSIEWQDTSTNHWCERNNVTIQDTFIDAGYSAKTFDRPDFEKLSAFIAKHYRNVDYLVVNQMDRFSRDAGEALSLIKKLQTKYSIQISSVSEGIIFDYNTPGSFFRTGLQLLLAEDDNINRAQKINSGIYSSKATEGRYIGAFAPYGYRKEGKGKSMKLVIVPEEAKIIQYIFTSYKQNVPIMQIYKDAVKMGLKKKGNSVIPKILTNPIYSGQQLVKSWKDMPGGLFPGTHEAIIDMVMWQQVQWQLKGGDKNKVSQSDQLPLRGILHCHCGRLLTGAPSRGRHGNYYYYYKCNTTSQHNNISAKKAHNQLQEILGYLSVPEHLVEDIQSTSEQLMNEQLQENKKLLAKCKRDLEAAEETLISIETKWIANQLSFESYNRWYNDSVQKRTYLKAQIESLSRNENELFMLMQENIYSLTDMQSLYNAAQITEQQQLLGMVFDNSLYYKNEIYRTPYLFEIFTHNELILKQKQLLEIDKKRDNRMIIPEGGAAGSLIEPLTNILSLVKSIRVA